MADQLISVNKPFISFLIKEDNCPICMVHCIDSYKRFYKFIINSDGIDSIEEIGAKEQDKESYNGHIYALSVLTQKDPPRVVKWYNGNIPQGYELVNSSTFANHLSEKSLPEFKNTLREIIKEDICQLIAEYDNWLSSSKQR